MYNLKKYLFAFFLIALLVAVRAFETKIFYDPFVVFFKNDYLYAALPNFHFGKLLVSMFFRFFINTIISLLLLHLWFQNWSYLRIALKIYTVSFVVFIGIYAFYLSTGFQSGYLIPFYIRRFLIHPVLLLLLLAAFFYDSKSNVKN